MKRPPKARALRADAQRNREHVLGVAESVFAAEGLAVPIDEIARRAGLGVGTLYRHFPTKEALFAAIVVARIARIAEDVHGLADAPNPGEALFSVLERLVEEGIAKRDFMEALSAGGIEIDDGVADAKRAFRSAFGKLLKRAQRDGAVRADVGVGDVLALVTGAHVAVRNAGDARARARLSSILFDGLRPRQLGGGASR